jgi:hypothetical protein
MELYLHSPNMSSWSGAELGTGTTSRYLYLYLNPFTGGRFVVPQFTAGHFTYRLIYTRQMGRWSWITTWEGRERCQLWPIGIIPAFVCNGWKPSVMFSSFLTENQSQVLRNMKQGHLVAMRTLLFSASLRGKPQWSYTAVVACFN